MRSSSLLKFAGRHRRTGRQVGDADAEAGQQRLFRGVQDAIGKPSRMQQLPEPIPRSGKMKSELTGKSSGIYPAEQDTQLGTDEIRNSRRRRAWRVAFHQPSSVRCMPRETHHSSRVRSPVACWSTSLGSSSTWWGSCSRRTNENRLTVRCFPS